MGKELKWEDQGVPGRDASRNNGERGVRAQSSGRMASGEGEGSTEHTGARSFLLCKEAEELELRSNRARN